jgi:hypothetical protein
VKTLNILTPFFIGILIITLVRNWGIKKAEKAYRKGILDSLGKPAPAIQRLKNGDDYHFIFVTKVGPDRMVFLVQNKFRDGGIIYCEISKGIKLTINSTRDAFPRSGSVYRVKIPSETLIVLETIEIRR